MLGRGDDMTDQEKIARAKEIIHGFGVLIIPLLEDSKRHYPDEAKILVKTIKDTKTVMEEARKW